MAIDKKIIIGVAIAVASIAAYFMHRKSPAELLMAERERLKAESSAALPAARLGNDSALQLRSRNQARLIEIREQLRAMGLE